MLRKTAVLLSVLFCLSLAVHAVAKEKIINGIDANFPPFAYVDKTGAADGFDVEVMNWIAADLGMEVTHQPTDWSGIIQSLMTGKVDIVASGMSITEQRSKMVDFSKPYWVIKQLIVAKKESALTPEEVMKGGKTVGVQQGTSDAKWLKDHAGKDGYNYTLRYYNSSPLAVEDILNGRIDAAIMNDAPAKDAVSKKAVKIVGDAGMPAEEFGYAVKKGNTELLDKINASLARIMALPLWDELIEKYQLNTPH